MVLCGCPRQCRCIHHLEADDTGLDRHRVACEASTRQTQEILVVAATIGATAAADHEAAAAAIHRGIDTGDRPGAEAGIGMTHAADPVVTVIVDVEADRTPLNRAIRRPGRDSALNVVKVVNEGDNGGALVHIRGRDRAPPRTHEVRWTTPPSEVITGAEVASEVGALSNTLRSVSKKRVFQLASKSRVLAI